MDQLEILSRLEKLLVEWEKQMSQHYARLDQEVAATITEAYGKGETLAEQQRYNRLESLKKQIDRSATDSYSQLVKDVSEVQEQTFNEVYLLYTYLLYTYFSQEQGQALSVTSAAAATNTFAKIIYELLKLLKPSWKEYKQLDDSYDVLSKYKNDYVYSIFNTDIRDNLRTEAGLSDVLKRTKVRTEKAKNRSILALRYYFDNAYNAVQEAIYNVMAKATEKTPDEVSKLWVSRKDYKVRYAHQVLDGTLSKKGWFHYGTDKARRPFGFRSPELNFGCRCKVFISFNGRLPRISRIYDYRDGKYLIKLDERIEQLQKDGKTYIQALQQAHKEIKPPRKILPYYITYENWLDEFGFKVS